MGASQDARRRPPPDAAAEPAASEAKAAAAAEGLHSAAPPALPEKVGEAPLLAVPAGSSAPVLAPPPPLLELEPDDPAPLPAAAAPPAAGLVGRSQCPQVRYRSGGSFTMYMATACSDERKKPERSSAAVS
jgi:hypothetical protein